MSKKISILLFAFLLIFTTACSGQATPDIPAAEDNSPTETISKDKVENTDYLAAQTQTDAYLVAEAEAGYAFEEPLVIVNPYEISPLTAIALFTTENPASISIEVEGKNGAAPVCHDFETVSTQHQIPIYGLYADEPAEVILTAHYEDGTDATSILSVTGDILPSDFVPVDIMQADTAKMAEGWTFLNPCTSPDKIYAIDETGAVRWLINSNIGNTAASASLQLQNGNFIVCSDKSVDGLSTNSLFEIDLTGRIVKEYLIYGYHHDMEELPNGNLLALIDNPNGRVVEDSICEIRRSDGEILRTWDLNGYFNVDNRNEEGQHISDINYGNANSSWINDWLHVNAIDYDAAGNTVLLSSRHQDAVIEMDLTTGEIVWVLSDLNDAFPEYLESKLLTPVGEEFEWQYGQHCVSYLPNGDVMVFDNGDYRSKTPEGVLDAATEGYSRAVIYRVDEENMTVRQMWQFGKEFGPDHLASYISGAQYLADDHYIVNFGGIVKDTEGNATYGIFGGGKRTEIYEIKDNEIIFHASYADKNIFRVTRLDPYANVQEIDLTSGHSRLGGLYSFEKAETIDFDPTTSVSEGPEVSATDNGVQLIVNANLGDTEAESLALILAGKSDSYRVSLTAKPNISYRLNNSEIPTGTYELYLEMDGTVYDLGLEWENLSVYCDFPISCQVEVASENGDAYGSGIYYNDTAFTVWTQNGGTLSVTPNEGFVPDTITIGGEQLAPELTDARDVYTFDLPAGEVSVTVTLKENGS